MNILFLSPVHPLLTPASAKASAGKPGNPLPKWQMQSSWVRALERQGHRVRVVKYTPDDKIRLNWAERVWWNFRVIRNTQKARLPLPDFIGTRNDGKKINLIILSLGADVLLPQTLNLLKTGLPLPDFIGTRNDGVKLVVLSGVSPIKDGNPRERAMAPLVDLVAVNDEKQAGEWLDLGAKRAVCLPISAMDPELHFNKGPAFRLAKGRALKDIDVLFVGTLTPERIKFLNDLKKLLPETVNFVVREFVWEEEYASLMSRAKIVLNPIRPEMKNGANLRMFEIPAFGALELASFGKKEWLTPGKEMLVYKDAEEAAGLIVKYLKDDRAREIVAGAGQRRVMKEHIFDERAKRLMEFIKVDSNKAWPCQSKARPLIDLSICIVNYKADKELKRCLTSIKKFTKSVSFEVIVIDNSTDNRWYSGGNNLALQKAKGKYVLFLNPDCYLTYDCLFKLVCWMDRCPEVGASEPGQIYDNGGIAPTGSLLPVWWVDGVELTELSRLFSSVDRPGALVRLRLIKKLRQESLNRKDSWRTEVISGAAMMVRKKVLDKVGGFDENLRLYYTDVDLCRRILNAGFEIWHQGEFTLGHSTRKSTGKLKWDELYDVYAQDAWNYYRKWNSHIGASLLYAAMKVNMFGIYLYRFRVKRFDRHELTAEWPGMTRRIL